jgi:transcription initiation factor TFIID subunit 10
MPISTVTILPQTDRKRLLALAAQKFVSDIAADAYQHARIRTNAAGGRARANQPGSSRVSVTLPTRDLVSVYTYVIPSASNDTFSDHSVLLTDTLFILQDKTRTTLTMEDLSAALGEYGINSRKPEFYL